MAQCQQSPDQQQLLSRRLSSFDLDHETTEQNEPLPSEVKSDPPLEDIDPQQERLQEQEVSGDHESQNELSQDVKRSSSIPGQTSDDEEPPPSYSQLLESRQLLPWPQYGQNSGQCQYQLLNEHLSSQRQHSLPQILAQHQLLSQTSEEHCPQSPQDPQLSELPLFRVLQPGSSQSPARQRPQSLPTPVEELNMRCKNAVVKLICLGMIYCIATVIAFNIVAFYFRDNENTFYPLLAVLAFTSFLIILTALRLFFMKGNPNNPDSPHPGPITDVSTTYRNSLPSYSALPTSNDDQYSQSLGMSSSSSQNHRYSLDDRPPAYTDIFPNS